MEMHPNFSDEEWRAELRRNIIYSAQEDKPMCFVADEYRITSDLWYKDLESLLKSSVCSEITRKQDTLSCLINIHLQQRRAARGNKKTKEDFMEIMG